MSELRHRLRHRLLGVSQGDLPGVVGTLVVGLATLLLIPVTLIVTGIAGAAVPGFGLELGFLVIPVALLVLFLVMHDERLWVYAALGAHMFMLLGDSMHKTGATEVLFGIIVLLGLVVWLAKELLWYRRPLIESSFDALFLVFFTVITLTTLIMCVANGGDLAFYFKEWGVLFDFFFYLPLKRIMKTKRDVAIVIGIFVLMAVVCAFYNFIHFRQGIAQAVFEWQIGGSRVNLNETTSMAFLSLCTAVVIYSRRKLAMAGGLLGMAMAVMALIVSFSRGPIVAGFIGAFTVMMMSPFKLSRKAVIAVLLIIPIGAGATYLFFPKIASNITESVVDRVASVGKATSDRSFNARFAEVSSIYHYSQRSPVLGYGFGVHYEFLDPLSGRTITTYYAHNGYAWMLFKFGLPLGLMLLAVLYFPTLRGFTNPPARDDRFHRAIFAAATGALVSMGVTHFTSNQFTQMSSVMVYPLVWALLEYVNRHGVLGPASLAPASPIAIPPVATSPVAGQSVHDGNGDIRRTEGI